MKTTSKTYPGERMMTPQGRTALIPKMWAAGADRWDGRCLIDSCVKDGSVWINPIMHYGISGILVRISESDLEPEGK